MKTKEIKLKKFKPTPFRLARLNKNKTYIMQCEDDNNMPFKEAVKLATDVTTIMREKGIDKVIFVIRTPSFKFSLKSTDLDIETIGEEDL